MVDLTRTENAIIETAKNYNAKELEEAIKEFTIKKSIEILSREIKGDYLKQDSKNAIAPKKEFKKANKAFNVTYKYADEDWKVKALDAVVDASSYDERISMDEVLNYMKSNNATIPFKLTTVDFALSIKHKIGCLFKKSGVIAGRYHDHGTKTLYWVE